MSLTPSEGELRELADTENARKIRRILGDHDEAMTVKEIMAVEDDPRWLVQDSLYRLMNASIVTRVNVGKINLEYRYKIAQ